MTTNQFQTTCRDRCGEKAGDRDDTQRIGSNDDGLSYVEHPVIAAEEIDCRNNCVLSIRQPWIELIMLGEKGSENRGRATNVRGRIAIYASLSRQDFEERTAMDRRGGLRRLSGNDFQLALLVVHPHLR